MLPRILFVALILVSSLTGCSSNAETIPLYFRKADGSVTPTLQAEVCTTPGARELGLMYRKKLGDQEGMLFIFPEETERSFWMKNTYLELDMIFLDAQKKIVSITARAVPLTTSARPSKGAAKYVLEVRGGRAEAWGLNVGSELIIDTPVPEPQ